MIQVLATMRKFLLIPLLILTAGGSGFAAWPPEPLPIACPEERLRELPAAVRTEVEALCSQNMEKRCDALERLGMIGRAAAAAVPFLIELLADKSMPMKEDPPGSGQFLLPRGGEIIGYRAASALASIGKPAHEPLIKAMREGTPLVRRIAVYGLGMMIDLPSGEPLREAFKDDDAAVRGAVLDALAVRNDPRAPEFLLAGLSDASELVRFHAAQALKDHPDPRAIEPLAAAFDKEEKGERDRAWRHEIEALGAIDDPRAVETLLHILKNRVPMAVSLLQHMPAATGLAEEAALIALMVTGEEPVIKEVQKTLEDNRRPSAVEPLIRALRDDEIFVQLMAAHLLLDSEDPRTAEPLAELRGDPSPLARLAAVKALEKWKPSGAAEKLGALAGDPSPGVRRQAVKALSDFGQAAEGPLAAAIRDDDSGVRRLAAKPLVELKAARGLESLLPLAREEEKTIRELAVQALKNHREPAATEALIAALKDPEADIRRAAAEGLADRLDGRIEQELFSLLGDREYQVAEVAVGALSKSGRAETLDRLFGVLEGGGPNPPYGAEMVLVRNDDPRIVTRLASILRESGDAGKRRMAAHMLGRKKGAVVEPLAAALKDPDRAVRETAMLALSSTGDPGALEPLLALLADPRVDSQPVIRALVSLRDPRTVDRAAVELSRGDNQIHRKIVTLLGELKDARAAGPLLEALKGDPDDSVRGMAAKALQQIGATGIVEPLLEALRDPGFSARTGAAGTLARIDDPRLEELFVQAVAAGDATARANVADALRLTTDPRAAKALLASLADESAEVRATAALGLANKKAPGTVEPLQAALKDPERKVRMNAAHALRALDAPGIHEPEMERLLCAAKQENHPGAAEVERLMSSLQDSDKVARREAAMRLGSIGDEIALEKLILTAREDGDAYVRRMATVSLRGFCSRGERNMEVLVGLMKDPEEQVRSAAASALGELEAAGVRDTLRACLSADDPLLRIGASGAFRIRRAKQDVPLLIEALRDPEYRIRINAVETLKMINDPAAVEAIIPLVEDPEKQVTWAARGALTYLAPGGDYNWPAAKWRDWWSSRKKRPQ